MKSSSRYVCSNRACLADKCFLSAFFCLCFACRPAGLLWLAHAVQSCIPLFLLFFIFYWLLFLAFMGLLCDCVAPRKLSCSCVVWLVIGH